MPGGLSKTTKTISRDNRSPGRDMNPGPPEYEAALTTRPRHWAVKMSMVILWVVTPYGLCTYEHFGETYCLHLQGWKNIGRMEKSGDWKSEVSDVKNRCQLPTYHRNKSEVLVVTTFRCICQMCTLSIFFPTHNAIFR
jgi:hypothetical protein